MDMFDKFLRSVLLYGREIWGIHTVQNVDNVHLKVCKNDFNVRKCTQNDFIYC